MTEERSKPDLSQIDPLRPAPSDDGATDSPIERVDRIGRGAAEALGSTPAVGVTAETISDEDDGDEAGSRGLDG